MVQDAGKACAILLSASAGAAAAAEPFPGSRLAAAV